MVRRATLCLALGATMSPLAVDADPIRYEGALHLDGQPVDGTHAFRLALYDAPEGGRRAGPEITVPDVRVVDGRFATEVDFALPATALAPLWLQVEVAIEPKRYEAVGARQALDGKGLAGACWDTRGNRGLDDTLDFLGTIDLQDVVIKANDARILTLSPDAESPNLVGGHAANAAAPNLSGATVFGGGSITGGDEANHVLADYGSVLGGADNVAGSTLDGGHDRYATVAGGRRNVAGGLGSFVAGGVNNRANADTSFAGGTNAHVRGPADGGAAVTGDNGTFIWSDTTGGLTSTGTDQFLVRATGGAALNGTPPRASRELTIWGNGNIDDNVDVHLRPNASTAGYSLAATSGGAFLLQRSDGVSTSSTVLSASAAGLAVTGDLSITGNASKPGGGSWLSSSDARLKRDIAPLEGALDRLLALRGVTYAYAKPDAMRPAGTQVGFVAQEVQAVFPDWVVTDADGYLAVGARGFEALSVESFRELARENAMLHERLEALEARLARLESRGTAGTPR